MSVGYYYSLLLCRDFVATHSDVPTTRRVTPSRHNNTLIHTRSTGVNKIQICILTKRLIARECQKPSRTREGEFREDFAGISPARCPGKITPTDEVTTGSGSIFSCQSYTRQNLPIEFSNPHIR